jgi:hypothetical protein
MEAQPKDQNRKPRWLNRTVLGIGLASLFSDWSHEMATTVMPVRQAWWSIIRLAGASAKLYDSRAWTGPAQSSLAANPGITRRQMTTAHREGCRIKAGLKNILICSNPLENTSPS